MNREIARWPTAEILARLAEDRVVHRQEPETG